MVYVVGDVQKAGAFTWVDNEMFRSLERCPWQADSDGRQRRTRRGSFTRFRRTKIHRDRRESSADSSGKAEDIELGPNDVLVVPTSSRKVFTTDFLPSTFSSVVGAAIYHY